MRAPGRSESGVVRPARPHGGRPILLATLGVPFEPAAATLAVDAAVEAGQPLVVANVVELELLPLSFVLGYDEIDERPEDQEAILAPTVLARSLGVTVERLRVRSLHPVDALLQVAAERAPALLVFGPDRTRLRPRRYRKAAREIRERAACLVWLAGD